LRTDCTTFKSEEKLWNFVYTGDEADKQAFIYHYKTDHHDCLCLGDGSDK
jgi:hypothetical protein